LNISKGQISNILIENKDRYHKEKDSILAAGLQVASYINVDDTGAITYMGANKLPQYVLKPIIANMDTVFSNDSQWNNFLADNGIVKNRHVQIATEGALIGSIIEYGMAFRKIW